MRLFFETSLQAQAFLATIPIGFFLALGLDMSHAFPKARPVLDVLCLLAGGLATLCLIQFMKSDSLRFFHLLALFLGALLYLAGFRALCLTMLRRFRRCRQRAKK